MARSSTTFQAREKHPFWTGEKPNYSALHKWIVRNYGKAYYCSNNINHKAKRFDWANINGEYKRKIRDWKQLCRSCHSKLDITPKK